jgi:hypothetical protein
VDRERYKVFYIAPLQLIILKKPVLLPVQEHLLGTAAVSLRATPTALVSGVY